MNSRSPDTRPPTADPFGHRPTGDAPAADDLEAEQTHLAASRAALAAMRDKAEALLATGDTVAGDAFSSESLGTTLTRRIAALADRPDTPLFFGRLDHSGDVSLLAGAASELPPDRSADEDSRTTYHIGRRHVVDDAGEPMVLDWRAPVSRAFYQASARHPMGVVRRRRFGFSSGALTSFEDEHLAAGEESGTRSRILTEEIERPRVGPMRDIVATIQPEQDELVRAPLDTSICVQGAPGTGKTAVGLHRAAYLLYTYRERLRKGGVLVVGPSEAFLEYIAAVLPTLGELDVAHVTVDDLLDHVPVREEDPPDIAALKHDGRMVEVVRRALDSHVREATDPLVVPDGTARHRVPVQALNRLVADARNAVTQEQLPYRLGRERLRARVVALLQRMAEARGDYPGETWRRRMSTCRPVTALLDAVWPDVRPDLLIARLFSDRDLLATASDGLLTDDEREALAWRRPRRAAPARLAASAPWTLADRVLVDEALGLIERLPSYGHVILDEAQDLSVMQCRAVARRSRHGSLTVLGDLAQGTAPWATRRWSESLTHLGRPDAPVAELTTGFRVPEAVLTMANRLLPSLDVDVPQAVSLRRDGAVRVHTTDDLAAAVAGVLSEALAHEGSIGVIAADATEAILRDTLDDLPGRVTLLPASLAKGLEYDHVVVVEPAEIVAAEPRGTHRLYVVLTRAVSRLDVVHVRPLPEALAA